MKPCNRVLLTYEIWRRLVLYSFFPFLIHVYFILPISLQGVSPEQAKYDNVRVLWQICKWYMSLSTSFIWLTVASLQCISSCLSVLHVYLQTLPSLHTPQCYVIAQVITHFHRSIVYAFQIALTLSCFSKQLSFYIFFCRFILSSLNTMMWVVLLTMCRRWIVPCFIWSRLQLVLFYQL